MIYLDTSMYTRWCCLHVILESQKNESLWQFMAMPCGEGVHRVMIRKFIDFHQLLLRAWKMKRRISPQTSEADQLFSWGGRLLENIILGILSAKDLRLQGSVNFSKVPRAWTSSLRIPRMLNLVQVISYSLFTCTVHHCGGTILATTLQEHLI